MAPLEHPSSASVPEIAVDRQSERAAMLQDWVRDRIARALTTGRRQDIFVPTKLIRGLPVQDRSMTVGTDGSVEFRDEVLRSFYALTPQVQPASDQTSLLLPDHSQ